MGSIAIMGISGDTKLTWNAESIPEITEARKKFEAYANKKTAKGDPYYKIYKVEDIAGKKLGEEIHEFDPNLERIVFVPPMQGG